MRDKHARHPAARRMSKYAFSPICDDTRVVGLGEIVQLDASITELADLALGWHVWRHSRRSPWRRAKT
jgi:hypothetical protein